MKRTGENKPAFFAALFFIFSLGTFYWGAPKSDFFSPVMPYFWNFSLSAISFTTENFFAQTKRRVFHVFFDASVFVYDKIVKTPHAPAKEQTEAATALSETEGAFSGPMLPDDRYYPSPELSGDGIDPFFLEGEGELAFEGALPSELFDDAGLDDFFYSGDAGSGLPAGTFLDANRRLRRQDFEEEITAILSPRDIVSSDSRNVMRRKFDKSGRLDSVTHWMIVDGRLQLSARIDYTYTADSRTPYSRKTRDYYRKTAEETSYTVDGNVKKNSLYYEEDDSRDLASTTEYEYDSEKNLTAKIETAASTGSQKVTRYIKNSRSKEWDFEVLINGVLTTKRSYTNDMDYTETEYFPEGFSAVSHYEKGALMFVQYMKDGIETRREQF